MIVAIQTIIFFRQSLLKVLDRILRPYYNKFSLPFAKVTCDSDDEECDDQVYAEFDDEKGVVFFPPVYVQRYAAVTDCLLDERWRGKLEKVVDLGHHDMSFIKYLKDLPEIKCILGVDIESIPLRCSSDLFTCDSYGTKRETSLQISLYQGNAADPDYRLIGCDAVVAIEMIEHMLPHDLDRLIHNIFGFIRPWVAVVSTPNGDFNVLFKALEANGRRRLDHFFEWTREQFHDWCSNIVTRYPDYTVSCQGIGPGPAGTEHIGCCSQMAVFVSKNYHKQQDLNLNSLAVIAREKNSCELIDGVEIWGTPDNNTEDDIAYPVENIESFPEYIFSEKPSQITLYMTSPTYSIEKSTKEIEFHDKTAQCDLDFESARNFLMFDYEEMCYSVLFPRKRIDNKVYEIEDVNSRLNCTTLQVKKFSKTTQNLIAKNKLDSLVHTREVIDEIRQLTRMLNFNKDSLHPTDPSHVWCNFNWGDNAPYWNQYYKIIREYNYPFESKSDDCRILELISEELHRLIDMECTVDVNRLEIPIHQLMTVVEHITDDVDKVRELLEWNGYEVVNDTVIYSRLVLDNASFDSNEEEWQERETFSDWDTDLRSTSISDGSTNIADSHGRYIRRALDHKVRKIRSMLTVDEDISTELDLVVCKLMKLALRTSKDRVTPPPTWWMQCKLLDLLTLTEKAIEKRRRYFIESYPLQPIEWDKKEIDNVDHFRDAKRVNEIVDKYCHLVPSNQGLGDELWPKYPNVDMELEDDLSISSTDLLKDYEYVERFSPPLKSCYNLETIQNNISESENVDAFDGTQKDQETLPHSVKEFDNSSGDTDSSVNKLRNKKYKKTQRKHLKKNKNDLSFKRSNGTDSEIKVERDRARKLSDTKITKTIVKKKSIKCLLKTSSNRNVSLEYGFYATRIEKAQKRSTTSKPIPESVIELCHPANVMTCKFEEENGNLPSHVLTSKIIDKGREDKLDIDVSAVEESFFIDIVTMDKQETLALRRSIGTDPDSVIEKETLLQSISDAVLNVENCTEEMHIPVEKFESQTLFASDIETPSTSKGIRHVSFDVQCGPDASVNYCMLSPASSAEKMPKMFNSGLQYDQLRSKIGVSRADFSCSTINDSFGIPAPLKSRHIGIHIQDSDPNIANKTDLFTKTPTNISSEYSKPVLNSINPIKQTDLNNAKVKTSRKESILEMDKVIESVPKSCITDYEIGGSKNGDMNQSINKSVTTIESTPQIDKKGSKLSYGAVHVHSFVEKKGTEDVLFQGEWQKYRPKVNSNHHKKFIVSKFPQKPALKKVIKTKENLVVTTAQTRIDVKKQCAIRKPLLKSKPVSEEDKSAISKRVPKMRHRQPNQSLTKIASKVTMSSISSRNSKKTYVVTRSVLLNENNKKEQVQSCAKTVRKNYLPLYLRKKLLTDGRQSETFRKRDLTDGYKSYEGNPKTDGLFTKYGPLIKKSTFPTHNLPVKKSFMVFRNEIEKKCAGHSGSKNVIKKTSPTKHNLDRSFSPQSQNSSTCSSPNSIATIRASNDNKISLSRSNSSSPNRDKFNNRATPTCSKNISLNTKSNKIKTNYKTGNNNKENIPEVNKNILKKNNNSNSVSEIKTKHYQSRWKSETMPMKPSTIISYTLLTENEKQISSEDSKSKSRLIKFQKSSQMNGLHEDVIKDANTNLYIEHQNKSDAKIENIPIPVSVNNITKHGLIQNWIENVNVELTDSSSNAESAIRQLIEETIDTVYLVADRELNFDAETIILNNDDRNSSSQYETLSESSFTSALTNNREEFHSTVPFGASPMNISDIGLDINDFDLLSFKSMPSFSGYLLDNGVASKLDSVREIFERKEHQVPQNSVVGPIAIQAFSGFSINAEPAVGDQIDPINLIDSETGSLALGAVRQVTSEEMFVSGRSSASYESCVLDEDSVVPDWLFQMISQQQSVEDEHATDEEGLSLDVPLAEPMYDTNSNLIEPTGAGAGAGDGRGIHSDYSQDSSGRGTSLSSSDTSSGPQSEAALVDPSLYSQLEVVGERIGLGNNRNMGSDTNQVMEDTAGYLQLTTSDIEADVSSNDTDVPDSSDN